MQIYLKAYPQLAKTSFICGNTLLHYAGNREVGAMLLRLGADLNHRNQYNETPLMTAIWDERTDVALFLVEQGADLHLQDREGNSALHLAATLGNKTVLQQILPVVGEVDLPNKDGVTPLNDAVKNNQISVAALLLRYGASPNVAALYEEPPLHLATRLGFREMVELLLQYGADPHYYNDHRNLPLSTLLGHLFKESTDPDFYNRSRNTPLHIAAKAGNKEILMILLNYGASPLITDWAGRLPQHVTNSPEIFQLLFAKTALRLKEEVQAPLLNEEAEEETYALGKVVIGSNYALHPDHPELLTPISGGGLGKLVYDPKPRVKESIPLGQSRVIPFCSSILAFI